MKKLALMIMMSVALSTGAAGSRAGGDADIPRAILGVTEEHLEAAFDEMTARYDTIENYFAEALGIDSALQATLCHIYLEK